jgi:hypothetical protein
LIGRPHYLLLALLRFARRPESARLAQTIRIRASMYENGLIMW